jgi:hypothetical protein
MPPHSDNGLLKLANFEHVWQSVDGVSVLANIADNVARTTKPLCIAMWCREP